MANAMVFYPGKAGNNSWARWMVGRTKNQNKNNLVSLVGKTGSGKTYTAIGISEIMSQLDGVPFTIDHVVFTLRDLMELINSKTLKKGSKIVFDEPQVSIGAREFQSQANKVFNYLLSTFRHRNLTLFFCTPFETLLDKSTRRLFHAKFETQSINRKEKTCRIKPRFLEYADFKTEPYRKQLIVFSQNENGMRISQKLSHWDVPKPSKKLIDLYEKKKLDFTDNLNRNISEKLNALDKSGKSMTSTQEEEKKDRKPLTDKQRRVMEVIAYNRYEDARKILGLAMSSISMHRKLAEKKGYTVDEFKNKGEND